MSLHSEREKGFEQLRVSVVFYGKVHTGLGFRAESENSGICGKKIFYNDQSLSCLKIQVRQRIGLRFVELSNTR